MIEDSFEGVEKEFWNPKEKRHMDQFISNREAEKLEVFERMFPNAPASAFDYCQGKIKPISITSEELDLKKHEIMARSEILFGMPKTKVPVEEKPILRIEDFFPKDEKGVRAFEIRPVSDDSKWFNKNPNGFVTKLQLFRFMFPGAFKSEFEKLNNPDSIVWKKEDAEIDFRVFDIMIKSEVFKKEAFRRMFPGASFDDFRKLESRHVITDELSFMEKFEKLFLEEFSGNINMVDLEIRFDKLCRQEVDVIIQAIKGAKRTSPERTIAIQKFTEGVMWLGMDLKAIGTENPYPESKNPESTKVEPTADGLKL